MHVKPVIARPIIAALSAAMLVVAGAPMVPPTVQPGPVKVQASETSQRVDKTRDFAIPSATTHIEVHWTGEPGAQLTAAFSSDGRTFSEPIAFAAEDPEEAPDVEPEADGETYGPLMGVDDITVVRVHADRPLKRVTVVALDASGPEPQPLGLGAQALGVTPIPGVISRAAWGADESVRFDGAGDERWPREYYPVQKLVVHHTAGANSDPNPAATVRAIYYFHAVMRRWGDIGYNYLIDEAGRVYEGRYSRDYWNGTVPSSDNLGGLAVAGGHAKYHNQGSMGISLLGTFTTRAPTASAQAALVRMLAWAAAKYHIDPRASNTYVNPFSGVSRYTPNITGHRDYQSTSCPGNAVYALLPTIRNQVAAAMNLWPGQVFTPPRHLTFQAGTYTGYKFNASGGVTASKPYTLTKVSGAPTGGWSANPRGGSYWYVTAGVWAGYWVQGSSRIVLDPGPPPPPAVEEFETARPVTLPAGARTGYRFNVFGGVTGSKALTLTAPTVIWATKRSGIPNQGGRWYYVTVGAWRGYWILETAGVTLGAAPPPYPEPIAIYNPARTLQFAPGTYVGYQYSRYGILAGSYSYTLTAPSSAPTSKYSTLPGQSGKWFYIIDGAFESYWIRESSGTTLAPVSLGPM